MAKCPDCDSGVMKFKVHVADKPESSFEMKCVICGGDGHLTDKQLSDYKAEMDLWCQCGNPSEDVTFYDDGQGSACHKHHYCCNNCGKVLQIG